ncbi:hypothetical protein CC86DRAFT_367936 [Ophiobolus disseminans]|uniref:Uncharacterized protein n=1 Tax=Ophiobolus disseminans TaxID=1469910 RepID=A0A6A7ABL0_9PLEO|nr:hypothetical protein CC86DRAFT_367936 [Ophiobolus disseminans]
MHKLPLHSTHVILRLYRPNFLYTNTTRTLAITHNKRTLISTPTTSHHLPTRRTLPFTSPFPLVRAPHTARTMSSDADYASFLDKANQDTGAAQQQSTSSKKSYGTKSVDTAVPKALEQVEEYYVSDADEPFEPVALKFGGESISADELNELLGGDREVEEGAPKGFERQYKKVIDAVKGAGNGEVKVFRVGIDGARAEYWVVGVDGERAVGLKALSVES